MRDEIHSVQPQDDHKLLEQVRPLLTQLEDIRIVKLAMYETRKKIGVAAATVLTPLCGYIDWLLLLWQRGSDDSAAGITFVVLGALWWWVTAPKRQYAKAYKDEILPHIAKALGNLSYCAEGKIPMDLLKPSKIIPHHHKYKSEDCFEGEYKGVNLKLSEIKLKERRRSGKRTRYVTVFKGLCVLLDMPRKTFAGHTILLKDFGKVGEWFKEKSTGLDRANLVDPEFEKTYDVYTNDQVEARYLIDPVMIEDLKSLCEIYEANGMSAAWFNQSMLILLPSKKNHFEPAGIYAPATDEQSVLELKHELGKILGIIDHLHLVLEDHASGHVAGAA